MEAERTAETHELTSIGNQLRDIADINTVLTKHLHNGVDYILKSIDNQDGINDDIKQNIADIFTPNIFYRYFFEQAIYTTKEQSAFIGTNIGMLSGVDLDNMVKACLSEDNFKQYEKEFKDLQHTFEEWRKSKHAKPHMVKKIEEKTEEERENSYLENIKTSEFILRQEDQIIKETKSDSNLLKYFKKSCRSIVNVFKKYDQSYLSGRDLDNEITYRLYDLSWRRKSKNIGAHNGVWLSTHLAQRYIINSDKALATVLSGQMTDTFVCNNDKKLAPHSNTIQYV